VLKHVAPNSVPGTPERTVAPITYLCVLYERITGPLQLSHYRNKHDRLVDNSKHNFEVVRLTRDWSGTGRLMTESPTAVSSNRELTKQDPNVASPKFRVIQLNVGPWKRRVFQIVLKSCCSSRYTTCRRDARRYASQACQPSLDLSATCCGTLSWQTAIWQHCSSYSERHGYLCEFFERGIKMIFPSCSYHLAIILSITSWYCFITSPSS
jgi:hypothetical protein